MYWGIPVSNGEYCAGSEGPFDGALDHVVGLHVHRGRSLVQHQDFIP